MSVWAQQLMRLQLLAAIPALIGRTWTRAMREEPWRRSTHGADWARAFTRGDDAAELLLAEAARDFELQLDARNPRGGHGLRASLEGGVIMLEVHHDPAPADSDPTHPRRVE